MSLDQILIESQRELIAAQAARISAMTNTLMQIDFLSTNHGGWFENDPWAWGQMMADEARTCLAQAIEAQRAATTKIDAVHESAVGETDAPKGDA